MNYIEMKKYTPPKKVTFDFFFIKVLSIDIAAEDYEVVMKNREFIEGVFGEGSSWPSKNLTLRQNTIDLGWHEKEFQNKNTFAYNIRSLDDAYLGCVYIYPKENNTAKVIIWTIEKIAEKHGKEIIASLSEWIDSEWHFNSYSLFTHENKGNTV